MFCPSSRPGCKRCFSSRDIRVDGRGGGGGAKVLPVPPFPKHVSFLC